MESCPYYEFSKREIEKFTQEAVDKGIDNKQDFEHFLKLKVGGYWKKAYEQAEAVFVEKEEAWHKDQPLWD